MKHDYVQPVVGHYGVFNGKRFREEIYPRVRTLIWETELAITRATAANPLPKATEAA
jgi:poly(3-hydroxybutyrate) depolymerase